jgi:hypothetical protein
VAKTPTDKNINWQKHQLAIRSTGKKHQLAKTPTGKNTNWQKHQLGKRSSVYKINWQKP